MFNRYLTYYPPPTQFVFLCAVLSLNWLLGATLIQPLYEHFTGFSAEQISSMKEYAPSLLYTLRWLAPMINIFFLLLPALIFAYLAYPHPKQYLGFQAIKRRYHILWGITWILCSLPFSGLLEHWNEHAAWAQSFKAADSHYDQLTGAMLAGKGMKDLLMNTFWLALFPAVIEEVFFRGCLQQLLVSWFRKQPILGVFLTAVLFSAFHMQMSGFVPRLFLGMVLGLAYYFSGSLKVSMYMHFANNFIAIFVLFLFHHQKIGSDDISENLAPWFVIVLSLLSTLLFYYLFQKEKTRMAIFEVDKAA